MPSTEVTLPKILQDPDSVSVKDLKNYLYGHVSFRTENYIANSALSQKEKFDVILCFSALKYVHLNFGDLGIKALFLKAFD